MNRLFIAAAFAAAVTACGGGNEPTAEHEAVAAKSCRATKSCAPGPAPAPAPAPSPAPAPDPVVVVAPAGDIAIASHPNTLLQTGPSTAAYWLEDGVWGAGSLTRGTYTGLTGTQYEQSTGVSSVFGPNGEVSGRMAWKWPTGTTEVKSYPSFLVGNKPGYANTWTVPGGQNVILLDGTESTVYPSGKTPGSFFPLQLPVASLKSSFAYSHNAAPTGRGHLSYDIWLQSAPDQIAGFGPSITWEIMIPLTYWGGYGDHTTRNPSWYSHDATIDGVLFHVYYAPNFNGAWNFLVFEPDSPTSLAAAGTLDLSKFINYMTTRTNTNGTPWMNGPQYLVSVELGVETVEGTGDLTLSNYRVWK